MKRIISLSALMVVISAGAFADIARPDKTPNRVEKPAKSVGTNLDIRLDKDAKEARLIIPKAHLKQLRAEIERLDEGDDTAATAVAAESPAGVTRVQTIVSGIFLSLAIVFGGIWFVRSGRSAPRTGKAFMALAGLAAIGSAATLVYANIGPPPAARSITGKMFSPAVHNYGYGSGKIRLEAGTGDRVTLIVPNAPGDTKPEGGE